MQRELGYGGKYLCYVFGLTIAYGRIWSASFIIKNDLKAEKFVMKKSLNKYTVIHILREVKQKYELAKLRAAFYRKYGTINHLVPNSLFNINLIEAGKGSYGDLNINTSETDYKIKIGSYVSIAPNVVFILQAEHCLNHISTYPFKVMIMGEKNPEALAVRRHIVGGANRALF